ncbi:MAG TPA: hypothetical protein VKD72_32435 [Gemmataceae bacterium]|nr:hypothetical protein [Gemmataceae bacterium]
MLAEAELGEYLEEIRKEVCSRCVERPEGGPPCAPLGKQCGVEMHLPQLIDAVREVHSDHIGPYLDNNRCKICQHCTLLHSSDCPCPMDYLAVLLVQAIETVEGRRALREGMRAIIAPLAAASKPGLEAVARAYEQAAGRWTGCDFTTRVGKSGLDLQGLSSADAKVRARMAVRPEEREEWRVAADWLDGLEMAAADAETEATLAVAAAAAGHWDEAVKHARNARAIEFTSGRPLRGGPFTWQPLYRTILSAARAHGWWLEPPE